MNRAIGMDITSEQIERAKGFSANAKTVSLFNSLKKNTSLVLIKQENLSRRVKRAIRHRLQAHEDAFISSLIKLYHNDVYAAMQDAPYIAMAYSASFLWDSFFFKPKLKSKLLESELKKLLQTTDGNKVVSYKHVILKKHKLLLDILASHF